MNFCCKKLANVTKAFRQSNATRTNFFLGGVRFCFFFYCLFAPFGKALENIPAILGVVFLCAYYASDGKNSNVLRLPVKWLFAVFLLFPFINLMWASWPSYSFSYVKSLVLGSIPLFFLAVESLRSKKDLRIFGTCLCLSLFVHGLDGMWQYYMGEDFIKHTRYPGRLTGAMKTPRVGLYLGMTLVPALLAWWALPHAWNRILKIAFLVFALFPPIFLLIFSLNRTGYLGTMFAVSLVIFFLLRLSWKFWLAPAAVVAALVAWGPSRVAWDAVTHDGRWKIWDGALHAIAENPLLGTGPSSYFPATQAVSDAIIYDISRYDHPHNIYLQWLVDGGVVGFAVLAGVLLGMGGLFLAWKIYKGLGNKNTAVREAYAMLLFVWAGLCGYLCMGVTANDFYRALWFAHGLLFLGASFAAYLVCKDTELAEQRS